MPTPTDSLQQKEYELTSLYKKQKRVIFLQKFLYFMAGFFVIYIVYVVISGLSGKDISLPFLAPIEPYLGGYTIVAPFIFVMFIYSFVASFFGHSLQQYALQENKIITSLIAEFFPSLSFDKNGKPKSKIRQSRLFPAQFLSVAVYGQITNSDKTLQLTDVGISQENLKTTLLEVVLKIPFINFIAIFVVYILKNGFSSRLASENYLSFRGLYGTGISKKSIDGTLLIFSNSFAEYSQRFLQKNLSGLEKIQLEDPRFTDVFLVYGSDQIESRYILSSHLMEIISSIQQKFGQRVMLSYRENNFSIAIENTDGILSFANIDKHAKIQLEKTLSNIQGALDIAENFRLTK